MTEFIIANVHLDHMQTETRQAQARVLASELNCLNKSNLPILLLGDFNEGPDGEVRKILMSSFNQVSDGWETLNNCEETSYHKFQGIYPEGKRIDWILHSKPFEIVSMKLDKRIVKQLYPSDHFPVLAEFK